MNINDFVKGWLVGNFNPSLFKSKDIEVGLKYYVSGEHELRHIHRIITEYTIVVSGLVKMNDIIYQPKSIITMLPGTSTDFYALEDTITLVIKTPSIPIDKEIIYE